MSIEDENNQNNSDNSSGLENQEVESDNEYSSPFTGLGVINLKDKKSKKKRDVTRGPLKNWDVLDKGIAKASLYMANAYSRGIEEYLERRESSASHKRDGAIADVYENLTKAIAKTIKHSGDSSYELAKAVGDLGPSSKEKKRIIRKLRKISKERSKSMEDKNVAKAIEQFNNIDGSSSDASPAQKPAAQPATVAQPVAQAAS